jgi:ABC-type uncharacterized transport system substrate-binding protein
VWKNKKTLETFITISMVNQVCYNVYITLTVSEEILSKSINSMQANLKKIENELKIKRQTPNPEDKFQDVMKISFCVFSILRLYRQERF